MVRNHDDQIEECTKIFVNYTWYWRSLVSGIVVVLGMVGGGIAWALSMSRDTSTLQERSINLDQSIKYCMENQKVYQQNQQEILKLLEDISKQVHHR